MPYTAEVSLKVYNALGQEVETLLEGELSAGDHSVMWNASGKASGMYFYRLKSGDFVSVKKCLLLK
jgi:flagellar hook assembly protein FlgD